jgi:hypothetical protein
LGGLLWPYWSASSYRSSLVIGLAKQFPDGTRRRAAEIVFAAPWVVALAASSVEGFNVHGPSVFLFFLVMPVSWLLALVLVIVAG